MTSRPTNVDYVECYGAILNDWLREHPEDRLEVMRDNKRIAQEFSSRGLPFFTIDLPALGKALDASLARGTLDLKHLPLSRGWKRKAMIPRLFKGFWQRLFDENGHLRDDTDPNCVFFLRTLLYFGKKVKKDCAPRFVFEAIEEYFNVEASIRRPPSFWDSVSGYGPNDRSVSLSDYSDTGRLPLDSTRNDGGDDEVALGTIQACLDSLAVSIGFIEEPELKPKHGPGAVSGDPKDGYKYNFPYWSPFLEEVLPFLEYGTHSCDSVLENSEPTLHPPITEGASVLIAVPKTQKGPRLIAKEPVCNQWMQQAVAFAFIKRMERTVVGRCVNIFDQKPSQEAALRGSTDGSLATIDLSSASDRLSAYLVSCVFRRNYRLLSLFRAVRTRFLENPLDKKHDSILKLRKFASMGSALTFPVQSYVFAALAISYGVTRGESIESSAYKVRVFGDDIIIPSDWVEGFVILLHKLELRVNLSKTFAHGFFRESCGMDAYRGADVTPFYMRLHSIALASSETLGYLAAVNNSFLKGLWHLSKYLEQTAPWLRDVLTVNRRASAYGLVTFCNGLPPNAKLGWDDDLQHVTIFGSRYIAKPPEVDHVESWNVLASYFFREDRDPTPDNRVLEFLLSNDSVIRLRDRTPARKRRGWIPAHLVIG